MAGGRRRKHYKRRGRGVGVYGGALTKEEISHVMSNPTAESVRHLTEVDKLRSKNPYLTLDDVYYQILTDLRLRQDQKSMEAIKKIQELQNKLDIENTLMETKKQEVANEFALAKISEQQAFDESRGSLERAVNRVGNAQRQYNAILGDPRNPADRDLRLSPWFNQTTISGTPVYNTLDPYETQLVEYSPEYLEPSLGRRSDVKSGRPSSYISRKVPTRGSRSRDPGVESFF
jgi:hypothetical protein